MWYILDFLVDVVDLSLWLILGLVCAMYVFDVEVVRISVCWEWLVAASLALALGVNLVSRYASVLRRLSQQRRAALESSQASD